MKDTLNFMERHPVLTFVLVSSVTGCISNCVKYITGYHDIIRRSTTSNDICEEDTINENV